MEGLIVISAGVAFGVLIAILWTTDRDLREKNRRLEMAESKLATLNGESGAEGPPASVPAQDNLASLERQLRDITSERNHLSGVVEDLRKDLQASRENSHQYSEEPLPAAGQVSNAEILELEQRISQLQEENQRYLVQVEKLKSDAQEVQYRFQELESLQEKVPDLERRVSELDSENKRLIGQVAEFRSSMRDKLKDQLDSLQDIYHHLELDTR